MRVYIYKKDNSKFKKAKDIINYIVNNSNVKTIHCSSLCIGDVIIIEDQYVQECNGDKKWIYKSEKNKNIIYYLVAGHDFESGISHYLYSGAVEDGHPAQSGFLNENNYAFVKRVINVPQDLKNEIEEIIKM